MGGNKCIYVRSTLQWKEKKKALLLVAPLKVNNDRKGRFYFHKSPFNHCLQLK